MTHEFKIGDPVVATRGCFGVFNAGDIGTVVCLDPSGRDVMVCFDEGQGVKQDAQGYESLVSPGFVKETGREWWTGLFIKKMVVEA